MGIGSIVSRAVDNTPYAIIRDEYGSTHAIEDVALPSGFKEGDDYAYHVQLSNAGGNYLSFVNE